MKHPLLLLSLGLSIFWFGRFALGLFRGQVKGAHPVEKKLAWIAKVEHPTHFWGYTLLHVVVFLFLTWVILGLWNAPAF